MTGVFYPLWRHLNAPVRHRCYVTNMVRLYHKWHDPSCASVQSGGSFLIDSSTPVTSIHM